MKKIICMALAVLLIFSVTACGSTSGKEQKGSESQLNEKGTKSELNEYINSYDLTGSWHLDEELCTEADLSEMFPGFAEWGSSMEIQSDGQIGWYIGAESRTGTYTCNESGFIAAMGSDLNGSETEQQFSFVLKDDDWILIMEYENAELFWVYGEQEDAPKGDE